MFYLLAMTLCLAVLSLVFLSSSVLLSPVVLSARRLAAKMAPMNGVHLLFAVRLLPVLLTLVTTFGFVLPAFLEYEPHSTGEGIGLRLDVLALAGALLLACMIWRIWRIQSATHRARLLWFENSERIYIEGIDLPIYRVESSSSLLAVTGIFRPKIFLSREIAQILSPQELRAALKHEIAHVAAFDNLKQVLLRVTQPPGWLKNFYDVSAEWSSASELAADRSSLARGTSVLDLSAALIKVGRLQRTAAAANAVASHLIPPTGGSSLEQRVRQLTDLLENNEQITVQRAQSGKLIFAMLLSIAAYIACVHAFLPEVHDALELLVR